MMKITIGTDCGNAPKKEFIKDLNIAFSKEDINFLSQSVTDDMVWEVVGKKRIEGKANFIEELEKMKSAEVTALALEQIITHGREAAANGTITKQNGAKYAFSDFYTFNGAKETKVKKIISYVIQII